MNIKNFSVFKGNSLKTALALIEKNNNGIIFATNKASAVIGALTDGDIRRYLLSGGSINDKIEKCVNQDFVWFSKDTEREKILKNLDNQIKVIPLLDSKKNLVSVISREHFPIDKEIKTYARCMAPARISFGGGGSDVTHFFSENKGAVINSTISLYSHALLRKRSDNKIKIFSYDLQKKLNADSLKNALKKKSELPLIQALIKIIEPEFGFDLFIRSDFPVGSGLGGSSVVSAAILGCFNEFRIDKWDLHELSEICFQAERIHMGISGGWQDQYATIFGGLNFMEFKKDQNIVHSLRLRPEIKLELEESLILCNTGKMHKSGDIHDDQKKSLKENNIKNLVSKNVDLCYSQRNMLLRGKINEFGKSLNDAWNYKKQFSTKISSQEIDNLYEGALKNGAAGGKILGAGGGGYFLFFSEPFKRDKLINYLSDQNLEIRDFQFDDDGIRSWSIRETN